VTVYFLPIVVVSDQTFPVTGSLVKEINDIGLFSLQASSVFTSLEVAYVHSRRHKTHIKVSAYL